MALTKGPELPLQGPLAEEKEADTRVGPGNFRDGFEEVPVSLPLYKLGNDTAGPFTLPETKFLEVP